MCGGCVNVIRFKTLAVDGDACLFRIGAASSLTNKLGQVVVGVAFLIRVGRS